MNKGILSVLFSVFILFTFTAVGQKWEKLGTRVVDYKLDRDVIHVGAHDGAFRKLRVEVRGGAVNMHKMRVEYMNGESQEIPLRHNFSSRSASRIIDLKGNRRIIKNVYFFYDTKNLARSKATVHLFGGH